MRARQRPITQTVMIFACTAHTLCSSTSRALSSSSFSASSTRCLYLRANTAVVGTEAT